uniref:Uncharacterized protein n=1 Tax=Romanomermis culicivorax TaxID=13658 RepID=A0A915J2I6_ROMCU
MFFETTYTLAASDKLSDNACLRLFSESNTPQVACRTESNKQSPAVRFHKANNRLFKRSEKVKSEMPILQRIKIML